jgi:ubiquitin C-terminal hydrolase
MPHQHVHECATNDCPNYYVCSARDCRDHWTCPNCDDDELFNDLSTLETLNNTGAIA